MAFIPEEERERAPCLMESIDVEDIMRHGDATHDENCLFGDSILFS